MKSILIVSHQGFSYNSKKRNEGAYWLLKRVIVANDIVGVGKVALSASIPIMAACQIEQAILPTCLLSSHTAIAKTPYIQSTSEGLKPFLTTWSQAGLAFDGFFSGYLYRPDDALIILDYIKKQQLPFVLDPIMADKGSMYAQLTSQHLSAMRLLAQAAQLILPNVTEACLLADVPYFGETYSREDLERLLSKLATLGPREIVLTGISFDDQHIGFAYYQKATETVSYHFGKRYPYHFYGTGDLVSAIVSAGYFHRLAIDELLDMVISFLDKSLAATVALNRELSLGIAYEAELGSLGAAFRRLLEEKDDIKTID